MTFSAPAKKNPDRWKFILHLRKGLYLSCCYLKILALTSMLNSYPYSGLYRTAPQQKSISECLIHQPALLQFEVMIPGSLVISNVKRISPGHTFQKNLLAYDSLLNKEDGKCSCIHKECVETAKKASNFWKSPLFGNILATELWLFKQKHLPYLLLEKCPSKI